MSPAQNWLGERVKMLWRPTEWWNTFTNKLLFVFNYESLPYIVNTLLVRDDGYFNFPQDFRPVAAICCLPPPRYQAAGPHYLLSLGKLSGFLSECFHRKILTLLGKQAGQTRFSTHLKLSLFFICKIAMSFSTTVRFIPLKKNLGALFLA